MTSVYRLIVRSQLTRGRFAALIAVGALNVLLAVALRRVSPFDRLDATAQLVVNFSLSLLVPLTSLVFASSALGDPVDDRTLVYIWLRPLARSKIALATLAATITVALPFAVLPTALSAALGNVGGDIVVGAAAASVLATIAYSTLFLGLGLVVRRALVWGLAYLLIWEQFVARSGTAAARLSILVYARSLFAEIASTSPPPRAAATATSIIVPLVVSAAALALTTFALTRVDVA